MPLGVLLALARAHPGQVVVLDDGAALADNHDDSSVYNALMVMVQWCRAWFQKPCWCC